jgi:hypothetical protein
MKSTRLVIFAATLVILTMSGCKKENPVTPVPPQAKTLTELKADAAFSWTTGQTVELKIQGLPTVIEVKNTLKVGLNSGTILFTRLHRMSEDLTLKLVVPSTEKQITLTYGTMTYTVDVVNGVANFSFIPNIQD